MLLCAATAFLFLVAFHARAGTKDEKGEGRVKIAVFDLKAERGLDEGLVKLLNELLLTEFEKTGQYEVIGGSDLNSMLRLEQKKQMLGCTDVVCLTEIGGALGVEKLASANIGKIGSLYLVNLKIVNVRESRVERRVTREVRGIEENLIQAIKSSVSEVVTGEAPKEEISVALKEAVSHVTKPPAVTKKKKWPVPIGAIPITLWSVGGAGLITGAVFGSMMTGHEDNANNPDFVGAQLEVDKASSDALVANIAFGVGAASVLAGFLVWLLSEDKEEESTAVVPILTPGGAGIGLVIEY